MPRIVTGYDLLNTKPHQPAYETLVKPLGPRAVLVTAQTPVPTTFTNENGAKLTQLAYRLDLNRHIRPVAKILTKSYNGPDN